VSWRKRRLFNNDFSGILLIFVRIQKTVYIYSILVFFGD
jgi:hypothetical protein